jgi:hypothetical protein
MDYEQGAQGRGIEKERLDHETEHRRRHPMKICDRCGARPITTVYENKMDGTQVDLCKACEEALHEFLQPHAEGKKPGRPKKGE